MYSLMQLSDLSTNTPESKKRLFAQQQNNPQPTHPRSPNPNPSTPLQRLQEPHQTHPRTKVNSHPRHRHTPLPLHATRHPRKQRRNPRPLRRTTLRASRRPPRAPHPQRNERIPRRKRRSHLHRILPLSPSPNISDTNSTSISPRKKTPKPPRASPVPPLCSPNSPSSSSPSP